VEFIVAEVKRGIDWFERFKVNVEFSLFSLVGDNVTILDVSSRGIPAEHDEAIWRNSVVQL
jgi:hypothetical protein